ncbi:hypothetical protein R6Q57_003238 [Mikania cordata]
MGTDGRVLNPSNSKEKPDPKPLERAMHQKPPFTIIDIKKVIPSHCFKRSVIRSFSYVAYDLTLAFIFYGLAIKRITLLPDPFACVAWPLYWMCQGCVLTGVWVIAHECGHHAFSDYQWLDDTVGLVLHSALLVPYFSWKYSHRRHHSNTGSIEHDEVFVPKLKSGVWSTTKYLNNPPGRILTLLVTLTLGWPLYLMFNVSGRYYDRFACHFDPNSPIYSNHERAQVFISDAGILTVLYLLLHLASTKGLVWVLTMYGGPLLVVNGFLVLITYLHHTHPSLPRYDSTEWDWLRGVLATIDRDYGVLNKVFHNITNTHVTHHLFSTMPHYHAMEATKAIKTILGDYYQFDETSIFIAMYRETKECIYVDKDEDAKNGVYWYRNKI